MTMHSGRDGSIPARRMSFIEQLRDCARRQQLKPSDPWTALLRGLQGRRGSDDVERISTEGVFDFLGLKPLERTPEAGKRLKGVMMDLGWTWVRARHVTGRGAVGRVRGYARAVTSDGAGPIPSSVAV